MMAQLSRVSVILEMILPANISKLIYTWVKPVPLLAPSQVIANTSFSWSFINHPTLRLNLHMQYPTAKSPTPSFRVSRLYSIPITPRSQTSA